MVEDIEMTPEPSQQEQAAMMDISQFGQANEDSMQVDQLSQQSVNENTSRLLKSQSSLRIPMFARLDSKMCMVTVLGFLLTWQQAEKFFTCLNTRGPAYFDTHKKQFRHFINDLPIPRMAINFGDKAF